jgi:protoheme IX farnesyltransferase
LRGPLVTVDAAGSAVAARPRRDLLSLYAELAKVRICAMVLLTTAVGFLLASSPINWSRLGWTLLGTALTACGAAALNQCCEISRDARMRRTCRRPLPTAALTRESAWLFGLASGLAGSILLLWLVNGLSACLAAVNLMVYVGVYTALKPVTPLSTLTGGLVGALPPIIGWTGATGRIEVGALTLGGLLFIWQIAHFLSLAWVYREDYARAGFRMLPVADCTGRLTWRVVAVCCAALIPAGYALALAGTCGQVYCVGSLVLGAALLLVAVRWGRAPSVGSARRVFLASNIYLPLLLGLMVADKAPTPGSAIAHMKTSRPASQTAAPVSPRPACFTYGQNAAIATITQIAAPAVSLMARPKSVPTPAPTPERNEISNFCPL